MKTQPHSIVALVLFVVIQLLQASNAVASTSTFDASLKTHLNAIAKKDRGAFEPTIAVGKTLTFIQPNGKLSTGTAEFKQQM